jgi:hypothetical protein
VVARPRGGARHLTSTMHALYNITVYCKTAQVGDMIVRINERDVRWLDPGVELGSLTMGPAFSRVSLLV